MSDTFSSEETSNAVIRTSPLILQELASMKIALDIWLKNFYNDSIRNPDRYLAISQVRFDSDTLTAGAVPTKIRKIIESCFDPIIREMLNWYSSSRIVLKEKHFQYFRNRFDSVKFGGDGIVNFKATIANFFEDDSLTDETKFTFACVYCFEEKIDFYWPLVCDLFRFDNRSFVNDPMTYYWICRKRNELNRLNPSGYVDIPRLMISNCTDHGNWMAIEYFLELLDPRDRLVEIDELFRDGLTVLYDRYLLPYYDEFTQLHIFKNRSGLEILISYIMNNAPIRYIVQCWSFIQNHITAEEYTNELIIRFVSYTGSIQISLENIWLQTPRFFKEFVLKNFMCVIKTLRVIRGKPSPSPNFGRNIAFILRFLSDIDIQWRITFCEEWPKWIVGVPPSQFDDLIRLCAKGPEEVENIKKFIRDTEVVTEYARSLRSLGYHSALREFTSIVFKIRVE